MGVFEIALPDGRAFEVEAPSAEAAHKAWQQHGARAQGPQLTTAEMPAAPEPGMSVGQDIKNLLPSLPGHAAAATFGLPGDLLNLVGAGGVVPTSEDWRKRLQDSAYGGVFGDNYQPQTSPGKFTKAIAENALGALMPGGLGARLANMAIPAIAGEAAGQATAGTAAEPYARFGGTILGGFGAGAATAGQAAARTADALKASTKTTSAELIKEGGKGFDAFRASGVPVNPADVQAYINQARTTLANKGISPRNAGQVYGELDDLEKAAKQASDASTVMSANDLSSFRSALVKHGTAADGSVRGGAGFAKGDFDSWLARTLPVEAPVLEGAVKNTRTGHLLADIENKTNRAQLSASAANSGMNTENRLRQVFTTELAKADEAIAHGRKPKWDADVRDLMRTLIEGDTKANAMRKASNYLGGGGGALASVYGLASIGTHPALALAPVIGMVIKSAGNKAALAKVDEIAKLITANAPFTQQQIAKVSADIAKAEKIVQSSQISAAKKSAMLQSLQSLRPANVAKAEEDK